MRLRWIIFMMVMGAVVVRADDPLVLFRPASPPPQAAVATAIATPVAADVIRWRRADLNPGVLVTLRQSLESGAKPARLRLELFPDAAWTVSLHATQFLADGGFIASGEWASPGPGRVILVVADGVLAADVLAAAGEYQVRMLPDGSGYAVSQVGAALEEHELPGCIAGSRSAPAPVGGAGNNPGAAVPPENVVDVLVVYTQAVQAATASPEAEIRLAVAEANRAFADSAVRLRIRLAGIRETTYPESGDIRRDLGRLRDPDDGWMDDVPIWRDALGADLVSLWVEDADECGISYVLPEPAEGYADYGFSAVRRTCATTYFSFVHELAHNLGAQHDPGSASHPGAFPYAYGFLNRTGRWRTVMAYDRDDGSVRLPLFSRPGLPGRMAGVAPGASPPDNARALNTAGPLVARYRTRPAAAAGNAGKPGDPGACPVSATPGITSADEKKTH